MADTTRAGEPWLSEEDERLRQLWLSLLDKMGRTHAGGLQRLNFLAQENYRVNWPHNPAAPSPFQVAYEPALALSFLARKFGVNKEVAITYMANEVNEVTKLPHYLALSVVERLIHLGHVTLRSAGSHRYVTIPDPPIT